MKTIDRIIFPLDYSDVDVALNRVLLLKDVVSMFKIGFELFTVGGPQIVRTIAERIRKPIMLDLKYTDIPTTVVNALRAAQ